MAPPGWVLPAVARCFTQARTFSSGRLPYDVCWRPAAAAGGSVHAAAHPPSTYLPSLNDSADRPGDGRPAAAGAGIFHQPSFSAPSGRFYGTRDGQEQQDRSPVRPLSSAFSIRSFAASASSGPAAPSARFQASGASVRHVASAAEPPQMQEVGCATRNACLAFLPRSAGKRQCALHVL